MTHRVPIEDSPRPARVRAARHRVGRRGVRHRGARGRTARGAPDSRPRQGRSARHRAAGARAASARRRVLGRRRNAPRRDRRAAPATDRRNSNFSARTASQIPHPLRGPSSENPPLFARNGRCTPRRRARLNDHLRPATSYASATNGGVSPAASPHDDVDAARGPRLRPGQSRQARTVPPPIRASRTPAVSRHARSGSSRQLATHRARALADATPSSHRTARRGARPHCHPAVSARAGARRRPRHGCRLLIADEVGLGKTVQAGLIVAEVFTREPDARVLVVCPAGLRAQWHDELPERFDLPASCSMRRLACGDRAACGANPWASHAPRPDLDRLHQAAGGHPRARVAGVGPGRHRRSARLAGASDRPAAAAVLAHARAAVVMLTATPHSGDDEAFRGCASSGDLEDDSAACVPPDARRRRHRHRRRTRGCACGRRDAEAAMHRALLAYARRVWTLGRRGDAGARLAMIVLMRRACSSAPSLGAIDRTPAGAARAAAPHTMRSCASPSSTRLPTTRSRNANSAPGTRGRRRGATDAGAPPRAGAASRGVRKQAPRARAPAAPRRRAGDRLHRVSRHAGARSRASCRLRDVQLHGGLTACSGAASARIHHRRAQVLLATDAASEGLNLHSAAGSSSISSCRGHRSDSSSASAASIASASRGPCTRSTWWLAAPARNRSSLACRSARHARARRWNRLPRRCLLARHARRPTRPASHRR